MSMSLKAHVKKLMADDATQGTDITSLKTDVGTLKTSVGKASGQGAGGLLKDMADAKAAIGADDTTAGGLKKRCKDIETAIGTEDTAASILGRIKALEDKVNTD